MRIIKSGRTVKVIPPLLVGSCYDCGCRVECIENEDGVMRDWYRAGIYRVLCPECSYMITLEEKQ